MHETEHGRHWNFFHTLAAVYVLDYIAIPPRATALSSLIWASVLTAVHQACLSIFGWEEYIIRGARDDLLSANKEGVLTLLGFWAIFRAGCAVGQHIRLAVSSKVLLLQLLIFAAALRGIHFFLDAALMPTSRRLVSRPVCAHRRSICSTSSTP